MASWKKVIVSGSQAELCSLTIKGTGGTIQNITDSIATTTLTGSFSGSFTGDGRELFNVTGSKVYINFPNSPNPSPAEDASILFSNETGFAAQVCASGSLSFNTGTSKLTTCQIAATGFTGSLNGNADTATTTTCATCIKLTETDTGTYTLVFATSGSYADPKIDNQLTYNASSNLLATSGSISATGLISAGPGNNAGTFASNGNQNVVLKTGNSTSGCVQIVHGAGGNISIVPDGAGKVLIGGTNPTICNTQGASQALCLQGGTSGVCVKDAGGLAVECSLTVGGNLIVAGDLAYLNVTNLAVEDKFILLNSGSANPDEAGIVIDEGSGKGHAFVYDADTTRWGFTGSLASTTGSVVPDAFAAAVVTSDISEYRKNGNIRVESSEIYIYVE